MTDPIDHPQSTAADSRDKGLAGMPSVYYYGPAHPSHESMFLEPPPGVRFSANRDPSVFRDFSAPPVYQPMRKLGVSAVGKFFRAVGSPRRIPILARCDLAHVDGAMLPITNKPWIVGSIEYSSAFFSFDDTWYTRPSMRNSLVRLLSAQKCRRILTHSEASLTSLKLGIGEAYRSIAEKTGVLPPVVSTRYLLREPPKRDAGGPVRILFVGNHFFDKGGRELLYAFRRLKQKLDVELILVTRAPRHHESYFESFEKIIGKEPGVRLYSSVPKDRLWNELYAKSDIFCLPTYMDTFGYVVMEAMANRLPVVATDMFALPEIVTHGETGLLVHPPIASFERERLRTPDSVQRYREAVLNEGVFVPFVDSLASSIAQLVEDGSLRRRMGEAGFSEVEQGRLSVPFRNRRLLGYYREALE